MVLKQQGKLDEALKIFYEALAISKRALGDDHPTVAIRLNNIASVLQAQGKLDEALEKNKEALEITKRALGEDHPNVATLLNNIAWVLKVQGKVGEARTYWQQALAIRKRVFGVHADVAVGNLPTCSGRWPRWRATMTTIPLRRPSLRRRLAPFSTQHSARRTRPRWRFTGTSPTLDSSSTYFRTGVGVCSFSKRGVGIFVGKKLTRLLPLLLFSSNVGATHLLHGGDHRPRARASFRGSSCSCSFLLRRCC